MYELISAEYMLNRDLAYMTCQSTPRRHIAVFSNDDNNYRHYQRSKRELEATDDLRNRKWLASHK